MNKLKLDCWLTDYREAFRTAQSINEVTSRPWGRVQAEKYFKSCKDQRGWYYAEGNGYLWAHYQGRVVGMRALLERLRTPLKPS
jgi:hypothetical protein